MGYSVDLLTNNEVTYSRYNSDEKLGAIRGGACVGHTERVRPVMSQRRVELVLKLSSPDALSPHACACGVSCLDHEALHTTKKMSLTRSDICQITARKCSSDNHTRNPTLITLWNM